MTPPPNKAIPAHGCQWQLVCQCPSKVSITGGQAAGGTPAVREDILRSGHNDIQKIITERVRAGECRCEETNPSGGCCLGAVAKAIQHAQALKERGLL